MTTTIKTGEQTAVNQVSKTCKGFKIEHILNNHYVVLMGNSPILYDVEKVISALKKKGYHCYGLDIYNKNIAIEFRIGTLF